MKIFGNIMWFLFGGGIISLLWFIAALLCFITLIGISLGNTMPKICRIRFISIWALCGVSSKAGHFLVNIFWIMLCGWEIAIVSLCIGLIWCVTIIGIQSIKFAQMAIMPFGADVVKV